jgi:hypothetical protein
MCAIKDYNSENVGSQISCKIKSPHRAIKIQKWKIKALFMHQTECITHIIESMSIPMCKYTLHLLTQCNANVTVLLFRVVNASEMVHDSQWLEEDNIV